MKNLKIKLLSFSFLFFLPTLTLAAADFELAGKNFKGVVGYIIDILQILYPILFSLAFITFFWGLSKFLLNSSKPEEIKNGKNYMLWSVVILFVLITYRTMIGLVANDLEINNKGDGIEPKESSVLLPTQ
jgi:hypothetical protein